jgi:predicted N-acyltransferase
VDQRVTPHENNPESDSDLARCRVRLLDSIHELDAAQWDGLFTGRNPFMRHALLAAMEDSGVVSAQTGWQPSHLVLEDHGRVLAALPLYLKAHSYGEFVFDWSWASAYQRLGLNYYPKALCAVPFMPCPGPRLGLAPGVDAGAALQAVQAALIDSCGRLGLSGWHLLFPDPPTTRLLRRYGDECGLLQRQAVQFRWRNRGYADFEAFLATFRAARRKQVRRERRQVAAQGITLERLDGGEASAADWDAFHECYVATYAKRSGHSGYLNRAFFEQLRATMPEQLMLVLARYRGEVVGSALCAHDDETLFGRYWGALSEVDCLHFEVCFYQGIEFCIERGLRRFDPGTQGEHKLVRGFEPVRSRSCHWIADARLRGAVADFLAREKLATDDYFTAALAALPFRRG